MEKSSPAQTTSPSQHIEAPASDLAIIRGAFADYLRGRGFAPFTIKSSQQHLTRVALWLHKNRGGRSLGRLTRRTLPRLLENVKIGREPATVDNYRAPLRNWLRFHGRLAKPPQSGRWEHWVRDYLDFLRIHRGAGPSIVERSDGHIRKFMRSWFGRGEANWGSLRATDILRMAELCARGAKPSYANDRLCRLRLFLKFVHMRGACSAELAAAVPKIAAFDPTPPPVILSEKQRRRLLRAFGSRPEDKRNRAVVLCMLDLGLRGAEVIALRLQDVDWDRRRINVPATKTGRGRELPIPNQVFVALRDYVKTARPPSDACDNLFIRHPRLAGRPLARELLKQMVKQAYRRCGFPRSWSGTHRLRHTFASRLLRRGVHMKPIADLLGHRRLDSTQHYTRVDVEMLRPLAQPWPN